MDSLDAITIGVAIALGGLLGYRWGREDTRHLKGGPGRSIRPFLLCAAGCLLLATLPVIPFVGQYFALNGPDWIQVAWETDRVTLNRLNLIVAIPTFIAMILVTIAGVSCLSKGKER